MFHYCSVPACGNNEIISPDDTFHFLPEVDSVRSAWIEKGHLRIKWERLGLTPLICESETVVCSQHFSGSDYLSVHVQSKTGSSGRILKPDATPSLELHPEAIPKSPGIKDLKERAAFIQLEKLSHGKTYTIQDYSLALLQNCTFADIEGKCHSVFIERSKHLIMPSEEKCPRMVATKKGLLIPSDDEKKRLSRKTGISSAVIQNICYYHQWALLRNSMCCDPFKKHELGKRVFPIVKKSEPVVTPFIYEKIKHLAPYAVPGEEICSNCSKDAKRLKVDYRPQEENTHIAISSQLETRVDGLGKTTSEVDMALPLLEETPAVNGCTKIQHEFVCYVHTCGLALANEASLVDHLMWVHLNEMMLPLVCEFCYKTFDVRIMYNKHTSLHKKEKPKKYIPSVQKSSLREKKDFPCTVCFQEFKSRLEMQLHRKKCRRSHPNVKNARARGIPSYTPCSSIHLYSRLGTDVIATMKKKCPYACNFCKLKFSLEEKLQEHIRVFHSGSNSCIFKKHFECHVCNKAFSNSYYLEHHLKWHAKANTLYNDSSELEIESEKFYRNFKPKCNVTNSKFEHEIDLETYLKQAHTCARETQSDGNILLKCNICSSKFEREIEFNLHLKEAHTSVLFASYPQSKPSLEGGWHCDLCQHIFSKLPELNKHLSEGHAVTKLFSCNVCGKRFHRCSDRSQHIAELKGEHVFGKICITKQPGRHTKKFREHSHKRYPCDICRKRFHKCSERSRHKADHHKGEHVFVKKSVAKQPGRHTKKLNEHSRKQYPCDICYKRFHKCSERSRHKADHHMGEHVFGRKWVTEEHLRSGHHARKFFCSICGAGFRLSASLLEHSAKHVSLDQYNQPACLTQPVMMNISFLQNLLDVYIS